MPLEGRDQLHLCAAHGYIELGMFEEANRELEEIACVRCWRSLSDTAAIPNP
jgi:hypothetical protein